MRPEQEERDATVTPPVNRLKAVILCGGQGTRLREETEYRPKPLVPIGNRPILWHIMKRYAAFGITDFILALGYKGEMIKDYFLNYDILASDFSFELGSKRITPLNGAHDAVDWRIAFVDTGQETMTGGRLKRLQPLLRDEGRFLLTYGDGVADIDIDETLAFHTRSRCEVTVTGVHPQARFGELQVEGDRAVRFAEKPPAAETWINGGYFVMTPRIFDYLQSDSTALEQEPLERLSAEGQLAVYKHHGYWQPMDTFRDMQLLNEQWNSGKAPWVRRRQQAA